MHILVSLTLTFLPQSQLCVLPFAYLSIISNNQVNRKDMDNGVNVFIFSVRKKQQKWMSLHQKIVNIFYFFRPIQLKPM
jgi:hypothetical protein